MKLSYSGYIKHKLEQSNIFINEFFPSKANGSRFLLTNISMTKSTDEEHGI